MLIVVGYHGKKLMCEAMVSDLRDLLSGQVLD